MKMDELVEEWEEEDEELRRLRRENADWEYIEKLPERVKAAILLYIDTGDLWRSAKLAGMKVEEFNELRIKAGILW